MPGYTKPGPETITKAPPIKFLSDGADFTSWTIAGAMQQTGTPTPDAPITPQECGERTAQLFDKSDNSLVYEGYNLATAGTFSKGGTGVVLRIPCDASTTYTISGEVTTTLFRISKCNTDTIPEENIPVTVSDVIKTSAPQTYTLTTQANTKYILIQVGATATQEYRSVLMLNTGSTALPYEPYGYKIPLSLSTTPIYLDEPIRRIGDYADTVSSDGAVTRRIKKLVLTGEENWTLHSSGNGLFVLVVNDYLRERTVTCMCSHYESVENVDSYNGVHDKETAFYAGATQSAKILYIKDKDCADATAFKSYLAAQYAAGTPVTVWYVLATPTTSTVTAPTLTTAKGSNVLTVDTTLQPSQVSITSPDIYHTIDRMPIRITKQRLCGHPPLDFTAVQGTLEAFTIYGNDGGVGDLDSTTGKYQIPVTMNGVTQIVNLDAPLTAGQSITAEQAELTLNAVTGANTVSVDTTVNPAAVDLTYPTAVTDTEVFKAVDNQNGVVFRSKNWFGFTIDTQNDDSDAAVTYTHGAIGMTPAHMDYTNGVFDYGSWADVWFVKDSYPVALNFDGTEAYRLDPNDYTKKLDGSPSDIQYVLQTEQPNDWSTQWKQYYTKSGDNYVMNAQAEAPTWEADTYYTLTCLSSTVNFMIAFPKVYFRRYDDARYNHVEIADRKLGDDWYCYAHVNASGQEVDYIYLPMFKGVIVSSKLRSIPGVIPQGGTTASTEVTTAEALGSRWQIWDHSSRELINDLLILMSKSIDCQTKFGKGRESGYKSSDTVTYGKLQTGTLIRKGQFFGYSNSLSEVKVFGIEGFWANRWDRLQGMLLDDNIWKIKMAPPYNFTGTDFITLSRLDVPSGDGYLSRVSASRLGSIPASISGGASNKRYRDYFYKTATGIRVGLVGGACSSGPYCGCRYVVVGSAASASSWVIGASPIYK